MQVHHIGYLVSDMNEAVQEFAKLGYSVSQSTLYDPLRLINICFMRNDATVVELIEPAENCRLFTKLQKRIGNAPYHIGYITDGGGGTMTYLIIFKMTDTCSYSLHSPQRHLVISA